MPAQDLQDFSDYWNISMFQENGSPRDPGGNPETGGVDYSRYLIPWCKGNSVSVDQSTLRHPRDLMSLLVEKYRSRLEKIDSGMAKLRSHKCGVTFSEFQSKFGKPFTKRTRNHAAGDISPDWQRLEMLLQVMLADGNIALFSESNTPYRRQAQMKEQIISDMQRSQLLQSRSQMYISDFLLRTQETLGHVRISNKSGWELYIRDYYGAPEGIDGVIPGNIVGLDLPQSQRAMPYPLHLVYAETMARYMSRGKEWGKNQSRVRRQLCDSALEGDGSSVSLDEYYMIFARNDAPHMADYFLQRSIGDMAAASYRICEVENSDPKSWRVRLDPDLVRWRENRRDRERERGDEGGDSK